MKQLCWAASGFFLALVLTGCGAAEKSPEAVRQTEPAEPAIPRARDADDAARFLAGLPGESGSPFLEMETSPAWQSHRASMDAAWKKAEGGLLAKLRAFEKQELSGPGWDAPVFYPFGGPDSLTVTLLFPRSPAYTIVGLEPAGTLPTVTQFEMLDLPTYLAETRATMASALGKSFFVTREMDKQFRGQITDGLLLPILELLVRTQQRILGSVRENNSIQVEFASADGSRHTLRYFSVNLSDTQLAKNEPFLRYLAELKGVTTFLKATSYMTHNKDFSTIRNALLQSSVNVLQDDSGIPYASFPPEVWDVQLYGQYTQPYGSFKWRVQADLKAAYAAGGAKPLALQLGYGYGRVGSNLLMARRKQ